MSSIDQKGNSPGLLQFGLATGLLASCCSVAFSIVREPAGLARFDNLSAVLLATFAILLPLCLLAWLSATPVLQRLEKIDTNAARVAFGVWLVLTPCLTTLRELHRFSLTPTQALELLLTAAAASLFALPSYFLFRRLDLRAPGSWLSALTGAAALLGTLTVAASWCCVFVVSGLTSAWIWGGYLAACFVCILTARRLTATGNRRLQLVSMAIGLSVLGWAMRPERLPNRLIPPSETSPPVILITIDTLRADALSLYRAGGVATPAFDELAADALVFENAVSPASWTKPAVASIFSGLSPLVHRASSKVNRLDDRLNTLAERLSSAGYVTAAVGLNPFLTEWANFQQGFDRYDFMPRGSLGSSLGAGLLRHLSPGRFATEVDTVGLTDLAIDQLTELAQRPPFFLWLHYFDPHDPYEPPEDLIPEGDPPPRIGTGFTRGSAVQSGELVPTADEREWLRRLYLAEVRDVDRNLGRLLTELKALGIYDRALIVLTSDHGEEFWEHGGFEHGHTLYDELLRVPLLVKLPGSRRGERIAARTSIERIAPTVLEICGIDSPLYPAHPSMLADRTEPDADDDIVLAAGSLYSDDRVALTFGRMKYILNLETGREELYDLETDPGETRSLVLDLPEKVEEARALVRDREERASRIRDELALKSTTGDPDRETIDALRSLGYVD